MGREGYSLLVVVEKRELAALFLLLSLPRVLGRACFLAVAALDLGGEERARGIQGVGILGAFVFANARDARYVAIIGADEAAKGEVTLRDLRDHGERRVPIEDVAPLIAE